MKIAMLLPNLRAGGAERVSLVLAHEFKRLGHEVEFLLADKSGELLSEAEAGFAVHDLPVSRLRHLARPLRSHLSKTRPDVLIANMWPLTSLAVWAVRGLGVKVVAVEHGNLRAQYANEIWPKRLALRLSLAYSLRNSRANVGVSQANAAEIAALGWVGKDRVDAIYNPVPAGKDIDPQELEAAHALWCEGDFCRVLSVGRLKEVKNHAMLLRAFARFQKERLAKLMLVGDGDLRGELEKLARDLGIQTKVIFAGYHSDLDAFYQSADLFCLSSRREAFGNVLVEALAAGLPIAATDCDYGPREILADGQFGVLASAQTEEALFAAMLKAVETAPDETALKARADAFAPAKIAAQYLSLFT